MRGGTICKVEGVEYGIRHGFKCGSGIMLGVWVFLLLYHGVFRVGIDS